MCNVTHSLLVIGKRCDESWNCLSQNVQCHSHAVGHRKICDKLSFTKCAMSLTPYWYRKRCEETAFHKMCNVTHFLFIIGKDVMRLPFTKFAMPLTGCWSYEKMWWDCLSQNVQCYSQTVGIGKYIQWLSGHNCNVTHILFARSSFALLSQCDMLPTCYIHWKDVISLLFTKLAISLTICRRKQCVKIVL